jgi:hypothetical protein
MGGNDFLRQLAPVEMVGTAARIACGQCGGHQDWVLDRRPPPGIIKKHFAERGWQMGRRVTCPSCSRPAKKEKRSMSKTVPHTMTATSPLPGEPIAKTSDLAAMRRDTAMPTDAAKRVNRQIIQHLEDAYEDTTKRYRPGWDDARIARETGAAFENVRKIREELFGPIRPPTEIEDLTRRVHEALTNFENLNEELLALRQRNGWA